MEKKKETITYARPGKNGQNANCAVWLHVLDVRGVGCGRQVAEDMRIPIPHIAPRSPRSCKSEEPASFGTAHRKKGVLATQDLAFEDHCLLSSDNA